MNCQFTSKCPIYNNIKTEMLRNMYRSKYCEKGGDNCQRKSLRLAGKEVPAELLPDGKTLSKFHFK